jgi:hypothetical protein
MNMMRDSYDGLSVRIEDNGKYLYVFVTGLTGSPELTISYWRQAIDECKGRGRSRLPLEDDFPNSASVAEAFMMVQEIARLPVAGLRIAYMQPKNVLNDLAMFAENVAVNRGMQGRVFNNRADAEAWLLQE